MLRQLPTGPEFPAEPEGCLRAETCFLWFPASGSRWRLRVRRPLVPLVSPSLTQSLHAWTFGHRGFGVATRRAARQNRTSLFSGPC